MTTGFNRLAPVKMRVMDLVTTCTFCWAVTELRAAHKARSTINNSFE